MNILGPVTQVRTWKCERQWYSWKQEEGEEASSDAFHPSCQDLEKEASQDSN